MLRIEKLVWKRKNGLGGGVVEIITLIVMNFIGGKNTEILKPVVERLTQGSGQSQESIPLSKEDQVMDEFVSTVFADCEDVWEKTFANYDKLYPFPKMVLFREQVQTACGGASSASGPFFAQETRKYKWIWAYSMNFNPNLV
jgi:predicted metalloprotease